MNRPPVFLSATVGLLLCAFIAGCSSPASQTKKKSPVPQAPADPPGASIAPTHDAVVEVKVAPDRLFEVAEAYVRKRYKITFINYSLRQFDAEDKAHVFAVRINELTSGDTGMCVTVTDRDGNRPNSRMARELANVIMEEVRQSATKSR